MLGFMGRFSAFATLLAACTPIPAPTSASSEPSASGAKGEPTAGPTAAPVASTAAAADPTPSNPTNAATWDRCGALECLHFPSATEALRLVLDTTRPRILAVGESHAPKGSEGTASSAAHFRTEWLTALRGRASDLVVELPVPPRGCNEAKQAVVEKVEKPVTANQRGDNQNEYLALANEAKRLGITPWALEPSCSELQSVSSAGEGGVVAMLELIARLTQTRLESLDARRPGDALLVGFGGALHNDVAPSAERASWSFGPALLATTKGRYVELDAFVPEHIKDTESWKRMPFFAHHDPTAHPDQATLYRMGPNAFVLVFPRTR